jgi:hypothetical protein
LSSAALPAGQNTAERDGAPRLVLEGSPRIGFRPLNVVLTGTLHGVSRADADFCHVDEIWLARRPGDPAARERASARRPRCRHPADQRRVSLRFYKDVLLNSAGVYTYRLVLEPRQGEPVRSNPLTIQILAKP